MLIGLYLISWVLEFLSKNSISSVEGFLRNFELLFNFSSTLLKVVCHVYEFVYKIRFRSPFLLQCVVSVKEPQDIRRYTQKISRWLHANALNWMTHTHILILLSAHYLFLYQCEVAMTPLNS